MSEQSFDVVREERISSRVPLYSHPGWSERLPWLFQATTGRAEAGESFDLSFFGQSTSADVMTRWRAIRDAGGFTAVVHARQVHSGDVVFHKHAHPGINIRDDADGHVTSAAGALLAVSIADCVPVSVVDEERRAIALLHAGWRGVAGGILERGIAVLIEKGSQVESLHVHFGPSICGTTISYSASTSSGKTPPTSTRSWRGQSKGRRTRSGRRRKRQSKRRRRR